MKIRSREKEDEEGKFRKGEGKEYEEEKGR